MPRRSSTGSRCSTSVPSSSSAPPVGSISRLIILSVVVLPQPDGPTSATVSPSSMSRLSDPTAAVGGARVALLDLPQRDHRRHEPHGHPRRRSHRAPRTESVFCGRGKRARPPRVVGARGLVREVEVQDQPVAHSAQVGALDGVQQVAPAAVGRVAARTRRGTTGRCLPPYWSSQNVCSDAASPNSSNRASANRTIDVVAASRWCPTCDPVAVQRERVRRSHGRAGRSRRRTDLPIRVAIVRRDRRLRWCWVNSSSPHVTPSRPALLGIGVGADRRRTARTPAGASRPAW